jgi:perosamine synthetase
MIRPLLQCRSNFDYSIADYLTSTHFIFSDQPYDEHDKNIIYALNGRNAFYLILKSLNLPKNSAIGIQPFVPWEMFESIKAAGLRPKFIDIDKSTYTIDIGDLERKKDGIDALVIVNIFGNIVDIKKYKKIIGDKIIIEDNAHLPFLYKDPNIRDESIASFYSFRLGKFISCGEGGIIVSKDPVILDRIKQQVKSIPRISHKNELLHSFKSLVRSLFSKRPLFGLLAYPLDRMIGNKVDLRSGMDYQIAQIRNCDKFLILKKTRDIALLEKISKQKANAAFLLDNISSDGCEVLDESNFVECYFSHFPIRFTSQLKRDKARLALLKKNIDSSVLWENCTKNARKKYEYKGDCKNAELISRTVLSIPNHYRLNQKTLKNIVTVLNELSD